MIDNVVFNRTEITHENIYDALNKINKGVEKHFNEYMERPSVIVVSTQLHYGLSYIMRDLTYHTDFYGNDLTTIFGIPCINSKKLKDMEFEIF